MDAAISAQLLDVGRVDNPEIKANADSNHYDLGLCGPTLRLPMTPLAASNEAVVEGALRASGLL